MSEKNFLHNNLGIIYDTLCSHITKSIVYSDTKLYDTAKNILKEFFIKSSFGKNELLMYKTISKDGIKDSGLRKSLIIEALKHTQNYSDKERNAYFQSLNKAIEKAFPGNLFQSVATSHEEKSKVYSIINECIALSQKSKPTFSDKKLMLEHVDFLIEKGRVESTQDLKNIIVEQKEKVSYIKSPQVVKSAIKLFNERYNNKEVDKYNLELIQDYIHYSSKDKLVESFGHRITDMLSIIDTKRKQLSDVDNIEEFYSNMKEYKSYLTTEQVDTINIEGAIKNISDFHSIVSGLEELVTKEN